MNAKPVYERDASWWNHPDTSTPKRLHRESVARPGMAHCGRIPLNTDHPWRDAPALLLCRRCFRGDPVYGEGRE